MSAKSFDIYSNKKRFGQITIIRDASELKVKMYNTLIVTKGADGKVVLNTGGWKTATTKTAMNVALKQMYPKFQAPYVFQKKGEWYVQFSGFIAPYKDGMSFYE